jgi:hypothetical protein
MEESGVLCLVKRRGGINNGNGEQLRREELWQQWSARGDFAAESRERRERKCSRKKKEILYKGAVNRRNRWMKKE